MPICKECREIVKDREIVNNICKECLSKKVNSDKSSERVAKEYCSNCGSGLKGNERFCPKCGTEISMYKKSKDIHALVLLIEFILFLFLFFITTGSLKMAFFTYYTRLNSSITECGSNICNTKNTP